MRLGSIIALAVFAVIAIAATGVFAVTTGEPCTFVPIERALFASNSTVIDCRPCSFCCVVTCSSMGYRSKHSHVVGA